MTKKIYSQEVVMQKYPLKTNRFMAIVMGVALLPLAAIAAPGDEASSQESVQQTSQLTPAVSNESASNKPEIQIINPNGPIESSNADDSAADTNPVYSTANDEASGSNTVPANSDNNPLANTSNNPIATKPSNADSVTSAYDQANERQRTNEAKAGTVVENPSAAPTKKAPWYESNYLLGGGLLLLILGGALLLFLKIRKLQDEIAELTIERKGLKDNLNKTLNHIKELKIANADLVLKLSQQQTATRNEHSTNIADNNSLLSEDVGFIAPVIEVEDLTAEDRQQLANSIIQWLTTNRGQTKLTDLVSADIQKKLNHWRYLIELWGQGDGVDSVDTVQSTMHASVISLTRPDQQGFAYCYKKPNSLSSVWVNKAWYKVQRTNSTLEVLGEPLEIN